MKCTYVEEIATDDLVWLIAMCALIYSLESLTCEFYIVNLDLCTYKLLHRAFLKSKIFVTCAYLVIKLFR